MKFSFLITHVFDLASMSINITYVLQMYFDILIVLTSTFKYFMYLKYFAENLSISTSTLCLCQKDLSISTSSQKGILILSVLNYKYQTI